MQIRLMHTRRLATFVLGLGVAAASAAPEAQAHHAPREGTIAARRVVQPPPRIITVTQPRGFDFGSASIGAGGAIGAVLVAGGSAVLIRRNRTPRRRSSEHD
jgi:hypothetical protein